MAPTTPHSISSDDDESALLFTPASGTDNEGFGDILGACADNKNTMQNTIGLSQHFALPFTSQLVWGPVALPARSEVNAAALAEFCNSTLGNQPPSALQEAPPDQTVRHVSPEVLLAAETSLEPCNCPGLSPPWWKMLQQHAYRHSNQIDPSFIIAWAKNIITTDESKIKFMEKIQESAKTPKKKNKKKKSKEKELSLSEEDLTTQKIDDNEEEMAGSSPPTLPTFTRSSTEPNREDNTAIHVSPSSNASAGGTQARQHGRQLHKHPPKPVKASESPPSSGFVEVKRKIRKSAKSKETEERQNVNKPRPQLFGDFSIAHQPEAVTGPGRILAKQKQPEPKSKDKQPSSVECTPQSGTLPERPSNSLKLDYSLPSAASGSNQPLNPSGLVRAEKDQRTRQPETKSKATHPCNGERNSQLKNLPEHPSSGLKVNLPPFAGSQFNQYLDPSIFEHSEEDQNIRKPSPSEDSTPGFLGNPPVSAGSGILNLQDLEKKFASSSPPNEPAPSLVDSSTAPADLESVFWPGSGKAIVNLSTSNRSAQSTDGSTSAVPDSASSFSSVPTTKNFETSSPSTGSEPLLIEGLSSPVNSASLSLLGSVEDRPSSGNSETVQAFPILYVPKDPKAVKGRRDTVPHVSIGEEVRVRDSRAETLPAYDLGGQRQSVIHHTYFQFARHDPPARPAQNLYKMKFRCEHVHCGVELQHQQPHSVCCQFCGAFSSTRYCGNEHRLLDAERHHFHCGARPDFEAARWYIEVKDNQTYFSPIENVSGLSNSTRTRQLLNFMHNPSGQYTIFLDKNTAALYDLGPRITIGCRNLLPNWKFPPVHVLQQVLALCFEDHTLECVVEVAYTFLRNELEHTFNPVAPEMIERLNAQFKLEFAFEVPSGWPWGLYTTVWCGWEFVWQHFGPQIRKLPPGYRQRLLKVQACWS